jgi:surface antigen
LRANNFDENHTLRPGEIIKVPPVSGVLHQVVSWDTVSSIAKKYDIWESVIKAQNSIDEWDIIRIWEILVIPWAVKPVQQTSTYTTPTKAATSSSSSSNSWNSGWYSFATQANSSITTDRWSYRLVRRQPQWKFSWWNCTRYVAQYKNVSWWWNANQWMRNASAQWFPTWTSPQVWAIIQFSGMWYNPRFGHVWIVMEVYGDYLIVSDMNYRRINEITYRKVPINDRSIDGYIYVD